MLSRPATRLRFTLDDAHDYGKWLEEKMLAQEEAPHPHRPPQQRQGQHPHPHQLQHPCQSDDIEVDDDVNARDLEVVSPNDGPGGRGGVEQDLLGASSIAAMSNSFSPPDSHWSSIAFAGGMNRNADGGGTTRGSGGGTTGPGANPNANPLAAVQQLVGMGFVAADAERALRMTDGDVDRAAALLID